VNTHSAPCCCEKLALRCHQVKETAAYYDEYAPTDRLDQDIRMMKATGIIVLRTAESTWGTLEPQEGCFQF